MSDYEGKDGLARDLAKLKAMYGPWRAEMEPHIKRFKSKPMPHEYTNLCTESGRAEPYFNGHIMAVATGLSIISHAVLLGLLIWKW